MPNVEQSVNSAIEPWSFGWSSYSGLGSSTTVADPLTISSGYPSLPCQLFRFSTNRNTFFTGKKFRKAWRQLNFDWYKRKPPPVKIAGRDLTLRKELLTDKMDWRRSKPVRSPPKKVPEGWTLVSLPTGKYKLVRDGYDPKADLSRFLWVPELRSSFRPVFRKWTRHNNKLPVEAKVNDLIYFHQTGSTNGFGVGAVSISASHPTNWQPTNPSLLGAINLYGSLHFSSWGDLGYLFSPFYDVPNVPNDQAVEDRAALLARWSDEIDVLSKVALRRLFTKLKNQKIDLATELSQSLLTVDQIASLAKRTAVSISLIRRGKLRKAFGVIFPTSRKKLANDYLAWKYGIKPLIGDIQGAAEHLAEYILRLAPLKTNGHAKDRFTKENTISLGNATSIPGNPGSGVYERRSATIRVKYGVSYGVSEKVKRQAAMLGFTNPANVVWEVIPFSFVVDWFLPIGDFLNNLSSLHGLVVKETYKTVFIYEDAFRLTDLDDFDGCTSSEVPAIVTTGSDRGSVGYIHWQYLQAQMWRQTTYCERKVIPLPDVPLPSFKNPISTGHVNSAVALFQQLFGRK